MNRIFVTGDTHGSNDYQKLNARNFPIKKDLDRDDYLIICGDFGGVWSGSRDDAIAERYPNYKIGENGVDYLFSYADGKDDYMLNWHDGQNYTTLFCDGNHENFQLLNAYPTEEWHGGMIHRIRPNVIHLMRGQIYDIAGKTFFVMGGASSVDKMYRKDGMSWWTEEMPSREEYETALASLEKYDYKVDYVISHCCATKWLQIIYSWHSEADELTQFFDRLEDVWGLQFEHWYFGHHHLDRKLDTKHTCLYDKVIEIK